MALASQKNLDAALQGILRHGLDFFAVHLNKGAVFTPSVARVDQIFQDKLHAIRIERRRFSRLMRGKSLDGRRGHGQKELQQMGAAFGASH